MASCPIYMENFRLVEESGDDSDHTFEGLGQGRFSQSLKLEDTLSAAIGLAVFFGAGGSTSDSLPLGTSENQGERDCRGKS
ncbi:hypothetical protein SAMN05192532_102503 [Alteribacillus iranensis]|uniref:Uncharacterized protein n=1 Tax=Alteribacillus iranensis TaxID=930128 RepID=A0A1I2BTQ7_9BACI|nr:hypothetical protein SAMN05192532_102503 [Alteribacillus iranensis]